KALARPLPVVLLATAAFTMLALPTNAFAQQEEQARETRRVESLDPRVARDLMAAYEKLQEDDFPGGLALLNALVASMCDTMKPFDLATFLQIRVAELVNLGRYEPAIRDFERAIQLDGLPPEQNHQLIFNVAQLYFQI